MSNAVLVNTYTYAATFVAAQLLRSLKQLIADCGLDVQPMLEQWNTLENGIATWLEAKDLEKLVLEVIDPFNPVNDLLRRFDFTIQYSYYSDGDGDFWLDPDTVRYAILKSGRLPSQCNYRILVTTRQGAATVAGWESTKFRSTEGMKRYSVGTAIGAGPLGASLTYYRRD